MGRGRGRVWKGQHHSIKRKSYKLIVIKNFDCKNSHLADAESDVEALRLASEFL
jgi:hypothetical protein